MAKFVSGRDHNKLHSMFNPDEPDMLDIVAADVLYQPPVTPQGMKSDIQAAQRMRADFDSIWKLCYDAYRDSVATVWVDAEVIHDETHTVIEGQRQPRTHIAMIKAIVDSVVASLATRAPKGVVTANQRMYHEAAMLVQLVTNWWWRMHGGNDAFRAATFDSSVCGHGWVKAAWNIDEETRPREPGEIDQEVQYRLEEAFDAVAYDASAPAPNENSIRRQVQADAKADPHVLRFSEHPMLRRISPFDMFIDPEADDFTTAAWCAQRFWMPVSEVQTNEDYDETARMMVTGEGRYSFAQVGWEGERTGADDRRTSGNGMEESGSAQRAMLWEYHDMRTGMWCVFADGADAFLIPPRESPFAHTPFRSPFEMLRRYDISEDLYPIGDVEPLLGPQQELDETRSQLMMHRRQLAQKFVVKSETLGDDSNRKALKSNLPGEVLIARDSGRLQDAIMALPTPQLPPDLYRTTDMILEDFERVSGITEMSRGIGNASRRTATEANLLSDASSSRTSQQLELHQEIAARILHRMVLLAQEFMSAEQFVPLVGEESAQDWVEFSAEDIDGQFHFQVEYGSMQPRDDVTNQQKAVMVNQLLAPYVGVAVNPRRVVEWTLDMFGVENPEEFLMSMEQQQGYAEETRMLAEAGDTSTQPGGGPAAPTDQGRGPGGPVGPNEGVPSGLAAMASQQGVA